VSIVAVIAGSGAQDLDPFGAWEPLTVETRFGPAEVRRGEVDGRPVLFAARHGREHVTLPHLINYRAIVSSLFELGAQRIIGISAVGSLSTDLGPGTAAVLTDFIDFTHRGPITLFDALESGAAHTDFSEPYCPEVSAALLSAAGKAGLEVTTPCNYVCTDGPRYETPAETAMLRSWGGDVVGMTNTPEAILSREAGICYGAIAVITNFAAGISPTRLSHTEVVAVMRSVGDRLAAAILGAIRAMPADRQCACRTKAGI